MESKYIVNVKIYGVYYIGYQQLIRIKVNVILSVLWFRNYRD